MINHTLAFVILIIIFATLSWILNTFRKKDNYKPDTIDDVNDLSNNTVVSNSSDILPQTYSNQEITTDAESKIHQIHYSSYSNRIFKLVSSDNAYYILVLDSYLHELQKIDIEINDPLRHIEIALTTTEQDGNEIVIFGYVDQDGINYQQFNGEGKCIYSKYFKRQEDIILIFHKENDFTTLGFDDSTYYPIKIFFTGDETNVSVDLSDGDFYLEKDWVSYEYVECITKTNRSGQFALIAIHANYGVQGVKIFEFDTAHVLKLVYDLDDLKLDRAFHNLAFNSDGSKFVVLLYQRDEHLKDYFSICEYSVSDDTKPLKIIQTDYGYWEYQEIHTYYLNNQVLCIVRNRDIILYDLKLEKQQELFNRDLRSAYFVSFGVIIYQHNGKTEIRRYSRGNYEMMLT